MKRLFAALLLAAPIFGAAPYRSILGANGKYANVAVPASSPWVNRTTLRFEFRLHDWTSTGRIFQWDAFVVTKNANTITATDFYETGSPTVTLTYPAGATDVIVRLQRTPTMWVIEGWKADGSTYTLGQMEHSTAATISPGGSTLAIFNDGGGGSSLAAGLAWFRVYSTALSLDSAPPSNITGGDLLDYEFEGNGTDSSAQALNLTLTGSPTFPSTPVVPFIGSEISVSSGRAFTPSCAGTNADSYKWRQQGGPPLSVTFSSTTNAAPTVTGLTGFGQYTLTCEATINGVSGVSTLTVGVSATNDAGVVILSDSVMDKLLGPMLRSGVSDWSWGDQTRIARGDYWYAATNGYTNDFTGTEEQNYYDSCLVHYQNYYRTGFSRFLTYARACSDKWYSQYWAASAAANMCEDVMSPRNSSLLGLITRAYESGSPLGSSMWNCLYAYTDSRFDNWVEQRTAPLGYQSLYYGARESAYSFMAAIALSAAYPSDAIEDSMRTRISNMLDAYMRGLQCQTGSTLTGCTSNYTRGTGSIAATNGSPTVTGTGTAFLTEFNNGDTIAFNDDAANYQTAVILSRASNTSLTLTSNYAGGAASARPYAKLTVASSVTGNWRWNEPGSNDFTGYGEIPWHSGLMVEAAQRAYYAGINTTTAATIASDYGAYLLNYQGNLYFDIPCTGTFFSLNSRASIYSWLFIEGTYGNGCASTDDLEGSRQRNVEMVGPHGFNYFLNATAAAKTQGDNLWSATFGGPVGPDSDNGYGLFMSTQPKMHGQSYRNPSYLVHRLGSEAADITPVPRTLSVGFSLAGVTNAAKIRATVTMPSGGTTTSTCTSSPCVVYGIDRRQGSAALLSVEYLSSLDAVLAVSDQQPVVIN